MKVTHVLTGALVACGLSASAQSIEQILNITFNGWYQGVPATNSVIVHDRTSQIRLTSLNIVNALAIERSTNYMNGQLIFKTSLDGSTTNIVIRQHGKTNELNVTDAFTFVTAPPATVDQVINITTDPNLTNSYVETGLSSMAFSSTVVGFTNIGLCNGTLRRVPLRYNGTNVYANLLNYTAGSGTFGYLITNAYNKANNTFDGTNFVSGPAQINFSTFSPVISPNAMFPVNQPQ